MHYLFDRFYKRYDDWYNRHRYAYLSEVMALRKVMPRKGRGIEIGVGTGRFAAPLGIKTGIDPSKKMLSIARQRGIKTRWGHGESLPFSANSFDYAALIVTLCFVEDPEKVLREAWRILRKKSTLVLGLIVKDSPLGRLYAKKSSAFYDTARFFTQKQLSQMLKKTGFEILKTYRTLSKHPGVMTAVEIPVKGQKGKGSFVVVQCRKTACRKVKKHEKKDRI